MVFIGCFENISSQRGIAWRCDDSRSLAHFLGYGPSESTPDHSTLSLTRERLPMKLHQMAFELILNATADNGLLKGKTLGVDATDLEVNASLKSIVRKDNGDNWQEYLRKLYGAETGNRNPDDEELRRFVSVTLRSYLVCPVGGCRLGPAEHPMEHFTLRVANDR